MRSVYVEARTKRRLLKSDVENVHYGVLKQWINDTVRKGDKELLFRIYRQLSSLESAIFYWDVCKIVKSSDGIELIEKKIHLEFCFVMKNVPLLVLFPDNSLKKGVIDAL